ncbi:hypothetical protein ABPG73_020133 [Tetrahymena malaccensis]
MQINGIDLMAQNNQLYFYNNLISGVQLNKWNQITIIYRQLFYNQINFIVNDDQATYRSFSLGSYMYQFVQAIFGDSMITDYFLRLNYIRIYEGLFLSNSPSCYMLAARQNQSCVICKSSYLIDYQNGINCVSPSSTIKSTIIDNVKDWFPKQVECPKNMILNNQNICVCMYHFYRNGDDCLPCQSYCQGCLDASTCIQKDPQRDSSGQCPNNQFDDGFQCLAPVFNLKSRKNILKTFAVNDFGDMCINVGANSDYIIPQSQLNLAKGVGFFFSFSVIIRQPHTQRTIAVLNDGPADLFTILFDTTTQNGQNLPCIQFYIKSNMKSQVILNSYNEVWIGLWSNFINAQYFVYADQFFYQQLDQNTQLSAITLNSPQLCIGKCNSILQSNYVCAQYSQIFFTLRIAYSNYSQIQNLMQQITAQIALFQIDFNNLPISNTLMDSISTKELKQNLNYNLNRYKGAQFTQYINEACIKNINLMENIPTISFYIFIERLSQQKLIVSIQLTSTENIQYFIVPYGNKFLVRICQGFACQDTQYAMLNQNQQNFLYIIQRARQTSQTNIILEFEVFCNYQRESLTFIIQKQTYQIPTDINIFPKESSLYAQDYSIYLNKIRFEVGNGSYYYDQNKSDNCFLYRNVSDMECMIPKQGYVFYQNNILITIEACKQRTQLYNSYHVINPSTQTCIDTQLSPYCQQVDEVQQNLVCSKCLYPGQNPIKNCQCDDGQFLNNQDLVCQNCSPRCKTCVNQYDNCLSCYQIDQYPPNCDCNLSNYFVNKNNQCQACSYMCNTCKSSSEFCLTCSNNRIDPPDCNCKENYIEINNRCQVQTCDLKCLACHSLTSNCVTCKNGRENPPICNCKTNFIENIDGTCTLCNFGDYYDNNTKSCQQCDIECLGCTEQASNCLACRSSLIQTKNKCSCQSGTSLAKIKNEFLCLKNMEVILTISLQSNSYILLFKFDEDIQQLDSKYLQNIEILIKVTFSEISLNAYKIGNPIINKNTLSVQLIVNTSFSTQKGWVLFLDNTQFISVSQQYMLNKIYTVNLINFQIGPFVFDRNTLDSGQLDKINDYYKNTNQNIFNLLKQFQIILYLLNSAQPTVLFLLLDAKLPPNLYKFYQVVGLIIFPDVVDYQTQNYKQDFKLFYLNLNQSEVYSSSRVTYKKLGLCNSFLVNTQGIIIKYLVFSIVLLIVKFLTSNQKFLINSQFERKMNSLNQTVKKLINSENDTNLLMIFQSILVQFITFDQQLWAVRYGYYLAVTFLIIFLASFYNNFQEKSYNNRKGQMNLLLTTLCTSFFLLIFAINPKENLADNQYSMIYDVQFTICDPNQSANYPQFAFNGPKIFRNYNSQTINSFAIVGWFILRGYNQAQDYNLITVTENSNLIFKVDYNQGLQQFYCYLLGGAKQTLQINGSPVYQDFSWLLSIFKIEYQSNKVNFSAQILSDDQNNKWFHLQTDNYPQPFKTKDLLINIGQSTNINYSSCVMIKYLYIYWDADFNDSYLFQMKYDLSTFDNFIVWFYDMFYTQQNPGYAIQAIPPNSKLPIYLNNNRSPFYIQDSEYFLTDFLNNLEQRGFIFTFHFKVNTVNTFQTIRILTFQPNTSYYVVINNNQLIFSGQIINGVSLNKWNQLTFIYKTKFVNQIYLLVNDDASMQASIPAQGNDFYQQIQFGSQSNQNVQIYLAYLRNYQGTFITDSTSCYLLAARQKQSCIICRYPYIMDYQNNFNCVLPSPVNQSTLTDQVKDWFPKQFQCFEDMILDNITGACKCRFQYYRYQNKCLKCKSYCRGCIDADTCIQMDQNRQLNGQCLPGLFDDGYSCINPQFRINSKFNYIKQLLPSDLGSLCINENTQQSYYMRQSDLKLSINQGFFFGFSFQIHEPKNFACIGFLSDGSDELILIMFKTISIGEYAIQFYVQGNYLKQIQVNINEQIWVAIWTDFVNAYFYVQNFSQIISTGIVNIGSYFGTLNFQNAFLCVGKCVSKQSSQGYICAIYQPIGFIYQMETPINGSQIQNLITLQTSILGKFTIVSQQSNSQISFIQDSNTSLVLNFNTVLDFIMFKGMKLTNGNNGQISSLLIQNSFVSLFCNIFIEQITYQVLLFQINYNTKNIQYNLVPYGDKAFIRICFQAQCRDTKYVMLNLNDYNFFGVISRNLSLNKQYFWYIQLEVICNYQTEILQFQLTSFTLLPSMFYILPQLNTYVNQGKFIFYINNLTLHNGDGSYYEDRNQQENGFLFVNVYQMECISPKQGYVIYQNKVISEKECLELANQTTNLYVVDKSNFQCTNTNLPSACQEFNIIMNTLKCTKCRYANADINNSCQCPEGTYLDISSQSCQKCSPRCLTCQSNAQNCIKCKYSDQNPPSCDCNNSNYFQNLNYECQPCSHKCKTCQITSNQCTACNENRSFPFCDCDSQFIEVNKQCQQIKCDDKCLKCEYSSSNCLQCNLGRTNPPICNCQSNFILNSSDGTCTECPSGFFYDSISQSCLPCILPCLKCINKADQCLVCQDGFQLVQNNCTCPNGNSIALLNNGQYQCIQSMEVNLNVSQQNGYYYLNFIFDKSIKQLATIYQQDIKKLINLNFLEIPSDCYKIDEPLIQGNLLKVKLNILKSFQSLRGLIHFLDCTQFVSISEKYVLNTKYQKYPLSFEIGPFLFENQKVQQQQLTHIKDYLVQNSGVKQTIQQFQFILYILNTVQPTVMPLLLKIQFPPNLYQFYQVIGLMIYPDVADYQSNNFKHSFQLYYLDLNQSEVYLSNNIIYQRLGFSNSCLVNSQGIVLKYLFLFLIFLIAKFLSDHKLISQKLKFKASELNGKLYQKINQENESNTLSFLVSFLVQFFNNDSSIWAVRYGYYVGSVLATVMIASIIYSYYQISSNQKQNKYDFSFQFIERINDDNKNRFHRLYFVTQQLKKYLIILILIFFQNYPIAICVINGFILILSVLQTIKLKPYKYGLSRHIKILGEFTFSVIWFFHIPVIIIEKQLYQQTVFDEKLIDIYFNLGYVLIALLLFFNILFVMEILFQCYLFIKAKYLERKNCAEQKNNQNYKIMSTNTKIRLTKQKK